VRRQGRTQRLADLTSLRRMELAAFSCSRVWASKVFNCLTVELCLRCHKGREDDNGAALSDRHQPVPLLFIVAVSRPSPIGRPPYVPAMPSKETHIRIAHFSASPRRLAGSGRTLIAAPQIS